ncbi:MAG: cytochrome P450 [Rhodobacteraceae bacterium]|nr:cytochrome P450 [Paracoccaceae bacterium]
MSTAPIVHIDLAAFWADPYPTLKKMRRETPIAFVPELNRTLLTRRDDIIKAEPDFAIFSSQQPEGLMVKLMGENLMRKDGEAHAVERKAIFPTVSPRTVRDHWTAQFKTSATEILDELGTSGDGDLFTGFATRLSGEALRSLTGLTALSWQDIDQASQAMIDGVSNYAGDPTVEARCRIATTRIDTAITAAIPNACANPGLDLLSIMLGADLPKPSIHANIKLAISGGQNEPRDVIAGIIWALLTHPDQLKLVLNGQITWLQVFEEFVRWLAPIGMSPRRVAQDSTLFGVDFKIGDDVFFMFGSANHDEDYFDNPEQFDITRNAGKHIAFGAGPHFCAGAWASKALIAGVALPMIFERLKNLRLTGDVRVGGWAFRGVLNLPCAWGQL